MLVGLATKLVMTGAEPLDTVTVMKVLTPGVPAVSKYHA